MNTLEPAWAALLLALANSVGTVVLWLRRPGEEAGRTVNNLGRRLGVLEERVSHMPTSEQLRELEKDFGDIKAELASLSSTVNATASAVRRIEEFLLNNR